VKGCGESGHNESSAWSNASGDHCSSAGVDAVPTGISLITVKKNYLQKLDLGAFP